MEYSVATTRVVIVSFSYNLQYWSSISQNLFNYSPIPSGRIWDFEQKPFAISPYVICCLGTFLLFLKERLCLAHRRPGVLLVVSVHQSVIHVLPCMTIKDYKLEELA